MVRKNLLGLLFFLGTFCLIAQERGYGSVKDIPYHSDSIVQANEYVKERCRLDVYYPKDTTNVPAVVWFHGGGLSSGEKDIPKGLREKGLVVVSANYRLHPKVRHPAYIDDAAAAVAWVYKNIGNYHGDAKSIFVSGHSAGGYLASMVGLDKSYLEQQGVHADSLAGLIPLSGHTITHFTIRKENNIEGTQPVVDRYSPLFHVRKDAPPMLLITGDRELELLGRYEENAYFHRMMKIVGATNTTLYELDGYGHNMVSPALPLLVNFVEIHSQRQ